MTTPDDAAPIVFERDGRSYKLKLSLGPQPASGGIFYACNTDATPADLEAAGFIPASTLSAERLARAEVERALKVGPVWTEEESDGMLRAFNIAHEHRGLRESLFAVGAWLLRHRAARLSKPEPAKAAEGEVEHRCRDDDPTLHCPACDAEYEAEMAATEPQSPAGEKDSSPRLPTLMGNAPPWCRIGNYARAPLGSTDGPFKITNYDTLHEWLTLEGSDTRWEWANVEPYPMTEVVKTVDCAGDPAGGGEERVIGQRCAACGAEWLTDMQVDELSDAVEVRCGERLAEIRRLRAELLQHHDERQSVAAALGLLAGDQIRLGTDDLKNVAERVRAERDELQRRIMSALDYTNELWDEGAQRNGPVDYCSIAEKLRAALLGRSGNRAVEAAGNVDGAAGGAEVEPPNPQGGQGPTEARLRLSQRDPFWALDSAKGHLRDLRDYTPADSNLSLASYALRDAVEYLLLRCPEAVAVRDARLELEGKAGK